MITDEMMRQWTEWARRDDWHLRFVGSDIRVMLGEIDRLRAIEPKLKTIIYFCEKSAPVNEGDWKDYTISIRNLIAREAREAMAALKAT